MLAPPRTGDLVCPNEPNGGTPTDRPNRGHGLGDEPHMMRRRWDYFVGHLLGAEPPQGYEICQLTEPIR